jgi:hypothetical protein
MAASDTDRVLNDIDALVDSFITSDSTVSGDAMRSAPEPVADDAYSRADAIRDGDLVEAPASMCHEAGLTCPVALTRAAWDDCVFWNEATTRRKGIPQDQDGRLWDVLWMTRAAIRRSGRDLSEVVVELYRVPRDGRGVEPRRTFLTAVAGPGDDGEMTITIALPDEF